MPVSLLDIAPPEVTKEEVDIRGTKLVLRGITNIEMAVLLKRFPLLAKQIAGEARRNDLLAIPTLTAGQAAELARLTIEPEEELFLGIETAPALIVAGLGEIGNAEFEAGVNERLSQEEQIALLAVVMRLTVPKKPEDAGPLAPGAGKAESAVASGTSSLPQ
jgi:hypothetical protein